MELGDIPHHGDFSILNQQSALIGHGIQLFPSLPEVACYALLLDRRSRIVYLRLKAIQQPKALIIAIRIIVLIRLALIVYVTGFDLSKGL